MLKKRREMYNEWVEKKRKRHRECEVRPRCMVLLIKVCNCTLSAPLKCRDAGWQLGTWPTHWTTKWEKWPAFTGSFKNSFTSCQIPLWPGTCTWAAGQDWACVLAKLLSAWPGSPVQWIADSPVSRFSGFSPSFFFLSLNFPHYLWCALGRAGDYQSAWNPTFTLLYNYCTVCAPKSISRED